MNTPSNPASGSCRLFVDSGNDHLSVRTSGGTTVDLENPSAPVTAVFGRTGAIIASIGDYSVAQVTGAAPLASPTFTGTPAAPTAAPGTNTTQIATTAFVQAATPSVPVTSVFGRTGAVVASSGDYSVGQVTGAAPLASPTFTGTPAAPTAAPGTNTTQIATTAFVQAATPSVPVTSVFGRTGAVVASSGDYSASQVTNAAAINATNTFSVKQNFGTPAISVSSTVSLKQLANGNHTIYCERNTDTAPTGKFLTFTTVGGSILFSVDVSGLMVADRAVIGVAAPHASAQLDVSSTTRGFLPPRMSTAERDAIASPAEGLFIYNVDSGLHQGFLIDLAWHSFAYA